MPATARAFVIVERVKAGFVLFIDDEEGNCI